VKGVPGTGGLIRRDEAAPTALTLSDHYATLGPALARRQGVGIPGNGWRNSRGYDKQAQKRNARAAGVEGRGLLAA